MGTPQGLIAQIDQVIAYFNTRRMDLPDALFDRKAQFVINGETFDSLLSGTPNDPLIMMLARGPAGYRFTAKALQHAMPDAKVERGELVTERQKIATRLSLTGTLRDTGEKMTVSALVSLQLSAADRIEIAEAIIDPADWQKICEARRTS